MNNVHQRYACDNFVIGNTFAESLDDTDVQHYRAKCTSVIGRHRYACDTFTVTGCKGPTILCM